MQPQPDSHCLGYSTSLLQLPFWTLQSAEAAHSDEVQSFLKVYSTESLTQKQNAGSGGIKWP
jgi:hypothetical protein